MWIPSHMGIDGNEQVDAIAKLAARFYPEYIQINYTDWYSTLREKINSMWDDEWQQYLGQLRQIKEHPSPWTKISIPR